MSTPGTWPTAGLIETPRLRLEPLRVEHASEAALAFDDVRLHAWTGGSPASLAELESRYRRQAVGHSPDGTQGWLNWMVHRHAYGDRSGGPLVGTVQTTLQRSPDTGELEAYVAWVVAFGEQGHGYAREAALAMARWLRTRGVGRLAAYVHPRHEASQRVARALGLAPTDVTRDGEVRWSEGGP